MSVLRYTTPLYCISEVAVLRCLTSLLTIKVMESLPEPEPEPIPFRELVIIIVKEILPPIVILYEGDPDTTEGGW